MTLQSINNQQVFSVELKLWHIANLYFMARWIEEKSLLTPTAYQWNRELIDTLAEALKRANVNAEAAWRNHFGEATWDKNDSSNRTEERPQPPSAEAADDR